MSCIQNHSLGPRLCWKIFSQRYLSIFHLIHILYHILINWIENPMVQVIYRALIKLLKYVLTQLLKFFQTTSLRLNIPNNETRINLYFRVYTRYLYTCTMVWRSRSLYLRCCAWMNKMFLMSVHFCVISKCRLN